METNTYYRVRPQSESFSPEDFSTLEAAIERANQRNSVRIVKDETESLYKGDNCIIQKVTINIENITR